MSQSIGFSLKYRLPEGFDVDTFRNLNASVFRDLEQLGRGHDRGEVRPGPLVRARGVEVGAERGEDVLPVATGAVDHDVKELQS